MGGVRVRIAEEVGEGDGGEGVFVGVGCSVKLYHRDGECGGMGGRCCWGAVMLGKGEVDDSVMGEDGDGLIEGVRLALVRSEAWVT